MILAVAALSLLLLYLPAMARPFGWRMEPQRWCRLVMVSLTIGAGMLFVSLISMALPGIFRALGAITLAELCDQLLVHLPHGDAVVGWVALGVAAAMASLGIRSLRRMSRALDVLYVEPLIGRHSDLGDAELVVLATDTQVAYSRAGSTAQVVISEGTISALTPSQLDVVIAHERAHLDRNHESQLRLLSVLQRTFMWLPRISTSIAVARLAIERECDEAATGAAPAKRVALADALASLGVGVFPNAVAAFSRAEGVGERIACMRGRVPPLGPSQEKVLRAVFLLTSVAALPALTVPALFVLGFCTG